MLAGLRKLGGLDGNEGGPLGLPAFLGIDFAADDGLGPSEGFTLGGLVGKGGPAPLLGKVVAPDVISPPAVGLLLAGGGCGAGPLSEGNRFIEVGTWGI